MTQIRIGISGWNYAPWRGVFYPKDLPHRRELEFASRQFNSIEINGSFYSLQRPSSYQRWHDDTPAGFVFSVKGGRFITHMKRLRISIYTLTTTLRFTRRSMQGGSLRSWAYLDVFELFGHKLAG
jgi:uncharacterized protein YecE (DUF72 family)